MQFQKYANLPNIGTSCSQARGYFPPCLIYYLKLGKFINS